MAKKRIVFIGGGAVGAYVAAHLVRGGEDVTVFDPWPENVAAINAKGIEVTGTTEQEHFIQAVDTRPLSEIGQLWQEAPVDIAFVCMKSYDTEWATSMMALIVSGIRRRRSRPIKLAIYLCSAWVPGADRRPT